MSDTKDLVAWLRAREHDCRGWARMLREEDGSPGRIVSDDGDKLGEAAAAIDALRKREAELEKALHQAADDAKASFENEQKHEQRVAEQNKQIAGLKALRDANEDAITRLQTRVMELEGVLRSALGWHQVTHIHAAIGAALAARKEADDAD